MLRLEYNQETQELLEGIKGLYWRYQSTKHNGIIPVDHKSHERMYATDTPEYIEEGVSCYDNPYQLLNYMHDEFFEFTEEEAEGLEVVIFSGEHTCTYGLDEEDIVTPEETIYTVRLYDFWMFCKNANEDLYYLSCKNLRELAEEIF